MQRRVDWLDWPATMVLIAGGIVAVLMNNHFPRGGDSILRNAVFYPTLIVVPVIAAWVHGKTRLQRVLFAIPYVFALLGLVALGAVCLQTVPHPMAALIVFVMTFPVGLGLLWLISRVVNRFNL